MYAKQPKPIQLLYSLGKTGPAQRGIAQGKPGLIAVAECIPGPVVLIFCYLSGPAGWGYQVVFLPCEFDTVEILGEFFRGVVKQSDCVKKPTTPVPVVVYLARKFQDFIDCIY
ncbi:hypothetical protein [uncultured Microbulbifer sp.]|uniref:hypothetical protein n=1 Tax=uncultured Microbulbifer sp. TaxID=348147 RepID=UPI002630DC4E|nr:hypothetical protein [uncultured Microbulbifer sp.]